jgi:hypothetical protein
MTSPGSDNFLLTMRWMVDVALSSVLPWSSALSREVASTTTIKADGAGGGSSSR